VLDDWVALTSLVLRCHEIYAQDAERRASNEDVQELRRFPPDRLDVDVNGHAKKLKAYLSNAAQNGWTVRLDREYEGKLQRMGSQSPAGATGNPHSKHFQCVPGMRRGILELKKLRTVSWHPVHDPVRHLVWSRSVD
jgi:hypothetical protein